ncbi:MAG: hypothetical protein GQ545_01980 [Candidatus Aminicenantes bacterium]|nr:hypothetical protein [Candidatus Aminicenantes bacterium]
MTGENIKRISLVIFVLFICAALLFSQSLVEIAKKEKERRAALKAKGKTSVVVTNVDLKMPNKLPVMAVQSPVSSPRGRTQTRQRTASRPFTQTTSQRNLATEDQNRDVYGYRKNATKVLFFTGPVANPEFALEKPDDQFAIISENGVLDLEFSAKNGPGADIAIFARLEGGQEMAPGGNEEGGVPLMVVGVDPREGYWYGILVMNGRGDWEGIGKGRGMNSPEEFDLGEMSDIKKIRIIFKPHNNPALNVKSFRSHNEENTLGIDAVEALH